MLKPVISALACVCLCVCVCVAQGRISELWIAGSGALRQAQPTHDGTPSTHNTHAHTHTVLCIKRCRMSCPGPGFARIAMRYILTMSFRTMPCHRSGPRPACIHHVVTLMPSYIDCYIDAIMH